MQTVNFLCGHCDKLMAVGVNSLGIQVRCPHCHQVVVAPTSASQTPTPSPSTTFAPTPGTVPMRGGDTFAEDPTELDDTLVYPPQGPGHERMEEPDDSTVHVDYQLPAALDLSSILPPEQGPAQPNPVTTSALVEESTQGGLPTTTPDNGFSRITPSRPAKPAGGNWFLWFLVLPLLSYAILSTILLIILYTQYQNALQNGDRLFNLPDEAGDNPGVKKIKTTYKWEISPKLYRSALPASLLATFHKGQETPTLHVGDLDVTPLKVEQKVVKVFVERSSRPEPCEHASLVLTLRLKNNAANYSFVPLDNYFDRHFTKATKEDPYAPLTQLEVGNKLFPGGPANWVSRADSKGPPRSRREWLEGRKDFPEDLGPGQEIETFVSSDGNNEDAVHAIRTHDGPFLWRVHLRRGLSTYRGKEFSRTAVVGIQFNRQDIEGLSP